MNKGSAIRFAALALLWGSSFLWIAIALRGLSPVQIVLIRLTLGALVLYPIIRLRRFTLPTRSALWLHLAIAAVFANVIPYTLFAIAEQHVSSSVAGVLNATTPLWTVFLTLLVGTDRKVTGRRLAGFLIGFAGTVVIFSPWQSGSEIASWGGLAALIAAASYGVSYVYMNRYLTGRGIEPLVLSVSQLIAASVILIVVAPFMGGLQPVDVRWDALAAVAILGAFGTGAAYVLNYRLITDEGTTASVVTYLLPIVAVILGAVVLGDSLTIPMVGGMVVVLVGVALTRTASAVSAAREQDL